MNNVIEKATASTKKFVVKHKTKLAVAATATVALVLHTQVVSQHNDFLEKHGLMDEFYHLDEED